MNPVHETRQQVPRGRELAFLFVVFGQQIVCPPNEFLHLNERIHLAARRDRIGALVRLFFQQALRFLIQHCDHLLHRVHRDFQYLHVASHALKQRLQFLFSVGTWSVRSV